MTNEEIYKHCFTQAIAALAVIARSCDSLKSAKNVAKCCIIECEKFAEKNPIQKPAGSEQKDDK